MSPARRAGYARLSKDFLSAGCSMRIVSSVFIPGDETERALADLLFPPQIGHSVRAYTESIQIVGIDRSIPQTQKQMIKRRREFNAHDHIAHAVNRYAQRCIGVRRAMLGGTKRGA